MKKISTISFLLLPTFLMSIASAEQAVQVQVRNPNIGQTNAWSSGSWSNVPAPDSNWDPFAEMADMQSRIHQMFEDTMHSFPQSGTSVDSHTHASAPAMDLTEAPDEFVVTMDMPGIPKESVTVEVQGDILSVRGERGNESQDEKAEEGKRVLFRERSFGAFERSVRLPDSADTGRVSAEHKDGQLTIHIPKLPEKKPTKVQIA